MKTNQPQQIELYEYKFQTKCSLYMPKIIPRNNVAEFFRESKTLFVDTESDK